MASAADMRDLSGRDAATASIFLNCHGNLEGYRNWRKSKPTKCVRSVAEDLRRTQFAYGCHLGYIAPINKVNGCSEDVRVDMTLTAWYDGVRVVILCLFLAYSKKKSLTLSAIYFSESIAVTHRT